MRDADAERIGTYLQGAPYAGGFFSTVPVVSTCLLLFLSQTRTKTVQEIVF